MNLPIEAQIAVISFSAICIAAVLSYLLLKKGNLRYFRERKLLDGRLSALLVVLLPALMTAGVFIVGIDCPGQRGCAYAAKISSLLNITPTQAIGFSLLLVSFLSAALVLINQGKHSENH